MVTTWARLAVTSVHQSCQDTKRRSSRPRVMSTSPRFRTPRCSRLIEVPSSLDLRVEQAQASGVGREGHLVHALDVIAQSEQFDIFAIYRNLLILVQRGAHGRNVTDRLDDVRGR